MTLFSVQEDVGYPRVPSYWGLDASFFLIGQRRGGDEKVKRPLRLLCLTLCDPMDCLAHQAPLSMGFSGQEYWSGLPFPSPGDLLHPGIKLKSIASPALAGRFFTTATPEKSKKSISLAKYLLAWPTSETECVNFFAAAIHRWAWAECLPCREQRHFNIQVEWQVP